MKVKRVFIGLFWIFLIFLFALFAVPVVVGNNSKEFKILIGSVILISGLYGGVQQIFWNRK